MTPCQRQSHHIGHLRNDSSSDEILHWSCSHDRDVAACAFGPSHLDRNDCSQVSKSVANLHGESSYNAHGNDCNSPIVKSTSRPNIPGPRLRRTDDSTTPRDVDRMVVRHLET